ncbi:MAG: ABC transporter permease [Bacteroidota bacterium]
MWRTNIRLAFRHLSRYKTTALINILGLAVGLLAYLLILQHLSYEWSFDQFHSEVENIYRVDSEFASGGERLRYAAHYYGMAEAMDAELPEVAAFCTFHYAGLLIKKDGEVFAEENVLLSNTNFPTFFDFPVVTGQLDGALDEPGFAILSKKTAERYFGNENPVGQVLNYDEGKKLTVKAVVEVPENSQIQFDFVLNGEENISRYREDGGIWSWSNFWLYVRLQEGTDPAAIEAKFPAIFTKYIPDDTEQTSSYLVPMADVHLHSQGEEDLVAKGNAQVVSILLGVAIAILLIGWINYINLATAQAAERGQEVGVRKVVGAQRGQLIGQFFAQSIVVNVLSLGLALVGIALGRPTFEHLLGHQITLDYLTPELLWLFGGFFLLGVVVSGLYPAVLISGVKPSNVLKGRLTNQLSGLWARRGLTVFQFVASMVLIAGTFAVYQQVSYMQTQELGFDSEQVLVVNGPLLRGEAYTTNYNSFKAGLQQLSEVEAFTATSTIPSKEYSASLAGVRRTGIPEDAGLMQNFVLVDKDFVSSYEIELLTGRNFQLNRDTAFRSVMLNEKAVRQMGFQSNEDAIGKFILWSSEDVPRKRMQVVGVVKDYHHQSLRAEQSGVVLLYNDLPKDYYSMRINTSDIGSTIAKVKTAYDQSFPDNPFSHFFLDESFQAQYEADIRLGKIMSLFGGLAIFIACLGLFGLASFSALRKMKEMGIRKVLGASLSNIVMLFTKDFAWLILAANVVGLPIAYLLIRTWLQNYAYAMSISPILFVVPALVLLIVSVLTISYHTLKTALANPVEHLRQE